MQPDFLIVGASISGCSIAMSLKSLGYSVMVVEQESAPREHFKGEYLQPFTVSYLRDVGLGEALKDANPIHALRFRDLGRDNSHVISEGRIAYPESDPALAIPHHQLVSGLRKILREKLGASFVEAATLEATNLESPDFLMNPHFQLRLSDGETRSVTPKIVIGCDGRQSKTRSWMEGPKPFKKAQTVVGAPKEFIVGAEIKNQLLNPNEYQVIRSDRDSTISIFALNPHHCRVYWNAPTRITGHAGGVPKAQWTQTLERLLGEIKQVTGLELENPVKAAGCPAFTSWYGPASKGRFFLAGDSLAVTTPFGGQGMTSGTMHAEALSDLFAYGIPMNDIMLTTIGRRYEKRCQATFAHFNLLNTGLYHLFFSRNSALKPVTQHILGTWAREPELSARMGRLFGGLDRDSPEVNELLKLWGVPLPKIYPLAESSLYIEVQRLLVPLMKWSNEAGKAIDGAEAPLQRVRQRILNAGPIGQIKKLKERLVD